MKMTRDPRSVCRPCVCRETDQVAPDQEIEGEAQEGEGEGL